MSVIVKDPSSKVNNLDLFVCDRKIIPEVTMSDQFHQNRLTSPYDGLFFKNKCIW